MTLRALPLAALLLTCPVTITDAKPEDQAARASSARIKKCIGPSGVTSDMRNCTIKEAGRLEATLQTTLDALTERLEPGQAKAVREAQEAWLSSVKASCGLWHELHRGTMYLVIADGCYVDAYLDRLRFLKSVSPDP
ncbi:MAG TPA: lysozyme inhibitor LprI family protein [Beijerinckiaceae bacterium]|jgi:uncharacterized protein YecT (DUF1311 family)